MLEELREKGDLSDEGYQAKAEILRKDLKAMKIKSS
jgi:hypothetical protein